MIAVLMMASCEASNVADNSPKVRIPDLPSNVYAKRTQLPVIPKDLPVGEQSKIVKNTLKNYELNERHNIRAINTAIKNNKNLQQIYGQ